MVDRVLHRRRFAGAITLASVGFMLASQVAPVFARQATPAIGVATLGWTDELSDDNGKLNVVTTVAPISSIARNIGGARIDLYGVVPDGTNSHTFEPAPSDARVLAQADIIFVNGLDLELPTMELAEANLRDGAEIVSLGEQTVSEAEWVFDFSFPEEDGSPNPHLWTNPPYAKRYAEIIAATLSARDPDNAAYYAENLTRYSDALDALDVAIASSVTTVPAENRKLLTYHDSWAYFAPRYGFVVIGAVQPSDFSEPSPQEVAGLIDQIEAERVPAVFGSEVFASDVLEQIAAEAGADYIDQLRDDAPPGEPNAPEHTYLGMMIRNMDLMLSALGGNADAVTALSPADTYEGS
ncbi:MAG: metal ABC transporter substrate-binding protein [Chloroflexota bacterium]|nr:metal ABC transporter substrate-binding protein [Chloroflexota bacterium]